MRPATRPAPEARRPAPPAPLPSPPPPRRPPPPVAALAPGAESQAAARVRPNSPEQRPARSRRSEPGSLGAGGGAAAPPGPGSFRFLAALQVPEADPRLHPVAAAAPARSLRAHARETLTHRGARGGRARPSRQLARGARRWPGEMHSEGSPGSRVPWSSSAEHCCRSAAPTVQVHVPEAVGVGQREPGRPVL